MDLHSIFATLVNMTVTGSIAICFVIPARFALKKAPKIYSYCLWAVVLFRLLCPVSLSSQISVMNLVEAPQVVAHGSFSTMNYGAVDAYLDVPEWNVPEIEAPDGDAPVYVAPPSQNIVEAIPENSGEFFQTPDADGHQATAEPGGDPIRYAVIIWLVGIFTLLMGNAVSCLRLFGRMTGAVPLGENIYMGDHVPTPFVWGLIRPRIYLPSCVDVSERRYIIAHERTHIKRMDHIVRLLAYLALCLHWFNPLVWLAFSLSGKDMEMSCDEAVIRMYGPGIRAEYSASLLRLATGRRSFALTPLAFGEGDTKGRVKNMAKWKKPGFWATILGILLCVAVLAACGVNPSNEDNRETNPTQADTENQDGFPWDENLSVEKVCTDAVDGLINAESYYIRYHYSSGSDEGEMEYFCHGDNQLIQNWDKRYLGSIVYFEGEYGMHLGDCWVSQGQAEYDADEWLRHWSPEGKELGHITVEDNSISFYTIWDHSLFEGQRYEGTFTYTFNSDGSLQSVTRDYILMVDGEPAGQTKDTITPLEHDPQAVYETIKAVSGECISEEEREARLREMDTITEIPSNKTEYDKNFELGSAEMGWRFHGDTGFFKMGSDAVTSMGLEIFHSQYSGVIQLKAEDFYWLETLVDGKWQYVDEKLTEVAAPAVTVDVSQGIFRYSLDWTDTYGELAPGYYRVGRYYTMTLDGKEETQPCYVKFVIMDSRKGDLLRICREGLENLLNSGFHIKTYELIGNDIFQCFNDEIWKMGSDYLSRRERTFVDGTTDIKGAMFRSGFGYGLSWKNDSVTEPVTEWTRLDYLDKTNFLLWTTDFEVSDHRVQEISQEGNTVRILLKYDYDNQYTGEEILYTFDEDGMIQSMSRSALLRDGTAVLKSSVEVLDTPGQEIRRIIDAPSTVTPMPFSFKEDVEKYPDAQKDGFINCHHGIKVETMAGAIHLATMECTLPNHYNMVQVYRDVEAGIWKVVLRYSQDIEGQYIYISDDGVTQMIVTE